MSRAIEDLEPDTRAKCVRLLEVARADGIELVVVHAFRDYEEQALLYEKGRTRPGPKVTNARPGYSFHNFGRALDVAFKGIGKGAVSWDGPWSVVGEIGERLGLAWGGRWKRPDRPHFENHGGFTLAELRQQFEGAPHA